MTALEQIQELRLEVARLAARVDELTAGGRQLITQKQAADMLGKKSETITTWRRKGLIRNYAPRGSRPMYLLTDIQRFQTTNQI